MAKMVDVVVLGGRSRAVMCENTDRVEDVLSKANVCAKGYDIFDENGVSLTTSSVVGDITQISLTKQVKGNIGSEVVKTWLNNRLAEMVKERDTKIKELKDNDPLQKMFTESIAKMTKYIEDKKIRNVSLPRFTYLTAETELAIEQTYTHYDIVESELKDKATEIDNVLFELAKSDNELKKSVLVARGVIDNNYNIL